MNEVEEAMNFGARLRQFGEAAKSLMASISESRANYYASYVADFSCIVLFGGLGILQASSVPARIGFAVFGFALFTLVEYSIHRWLLHDPRCVLAPLHAAHHNDPDKPAAFLFPTSLIVLSIVYELMGLAHFQHAGFFLCGFSAGYFYYGALHHFEHTTRINQIPFRWLQGRWAAHSVHHRLDQSNFGVMTSFWDHVFGTSQAQVKRRRMRA